MKDFTKTIRLSMLAGAALLLPATALADGPGAPHSLVVTSNYESPSLKWKSPESALTLSWHDGSFANGDFAQAPTAQEMPVIYAATQFDVEDLTGVVGKTITGISFGQYYQIVKAAVMLYEDGVLIAEAPSNEANYVKGKEQLVELPKPVVVKEGKSYRAVVRINAGTNCDFAIVKDGGSNGNGKGDLVSFDGKNYTSTGKGDYLITVHLQNDVTEAPTSYNVLVDGKEALTGLEGTSATLSNLAAGEHKLSVEAVYDGGKYKSYEVAYKSVPFSQFIAAPNNVNASVSDFDVALSWMAPARGANGMTWATGTDPNPIGGTASSNPKLWIRNQFTTSDINPFVGTSIKSIKFYLAKKCMTALTVWVQEDGKFVCDKALTTEDLEKLVEGQWNAIDLDSPVEVKAGHSYNYGLYMIHTAKEKPIAADKTPCVDVKGNQFSTSSASTTFSKSNPSYKTLKSGNIDGNWMLDVVLEGTPNNESDEVTYAVSVDGGEAVAVDGKEYSYTVKAPGTYTFDVVAKNAAGKVSKASSKVVKVALPDAYNAPTIVQSSYDDDNSVVKFGWSTDKTLQKYDGIGSYLGFGEEVDIMWGAQYTAAELSKYAGLYIKSLKFAIYESFGDFKVGVYTSKGVAKSEVSFTKDEIEEMAMYTVTLKNPVEITGEEDLYIAYSGLIPADKKPILTDAGPATTGGARVSFTGGATWMNLGTVNSSFAGVNFVVSALVGEAAQGEQEQDFKADFQLKPVQQLADNSGELNREPLIEALTVDAPVYVPAKVSAVPSAQSFNIYRNGELVTNITDMSYSEKLPGYNKYTYNVTAVYENDWESPMSSNITVSRDIDQRAVAPYGLTFESDGNNGGTLSWQSPDKSPVLSYVTDNAQLGGLGLTGTTYNYAGIRFSAEDLKPYIGQVIDHVQFALRGHVKSVNVNIIAGDNIIYTQDVEVLSDETTPENAVLKYDVRLNQPVVIEPDIEYGAAYYITFASGSKNMVVAIDVPAVAGYSDLASRGGSMGYWQSLKTNFKQDVSHFMSIILAKAGQEEADAQSAGSVTYNVYRDGVKVASGLTEAQYKVNTNGTYTVTAVDAEGSESGESNHMIVKSTSGVDDIVVDGTDDNAPVLYYNMQGQKVENPTEGQVVIRKQGSTVTKQVVK